MITPRNRLADIANAISRAAEDHSGPQLVVFDIDFAPQPGEQTPRDEDKGLCSAILKLADKVNVIALRPMVVDPNPLGSGETGFPSILDHDFAQKSSCEPAGALQKKRLWFASPLIESDPDGIVRSVYAWHDIVIAETQQRGSIPGIAFLGAALLKDPLQADVLRCYFDASGSLGTSISNTRQMDAGCHGQPIRIGKDRYFPTPVTPRKPDHIQFLLPYQNHTGRASEDYPVVPSQIETVEAFRLDKRLREAPTLLNEAIVVVGGSYWSSGDRHAVPLNVSMPGALVQANAILAYAMGRFVNDGSSLLLEFELIITASLAGALFYCLGLWAAGGAGSCKAFLIRLPIAVTGIVFSVLLVLSIGIWRAFHELTMTGTALGTLTPALAVALEGGCSIFEEFKHLLHEGITKTFKFVRDIYRRQSQ